jgi:RNA polymerase sigma-70 factor (ECF subfamily)
LSQPVRSVASDDHADRAARLRAGDPAAIRDALRELVPLVRGWLYRLLGASADLDDAAQEALAEIAQFLPRFEGRSSLATAAHRITVRVAYRHFGTRRDVPLEIVPELVDPGSPTDARLMAREALIRLHRCLERMPAKRRVAFVLCAIEGMTPAEAARVADTTGLAMRCRLIHARREIARMLRHDPYLARWLAPEDVR